jgi:hypothetical protein
MSEMLQVTVKRSEWNGNTLREVGASYLINKETGQKCCLGFAGLAAGLDAELLKNKQTIHGLIYDDVKIPKSLSGLCANTDSGSKPAFKMMAANDNNHPPALAIPDFATMAEKEAYIIAEGRKAGIEFTFVD